MDQQLAARLQSKSIKNSIINNIAKDFNLTPILAEAYFTQIKDYFLQHADVKLSSGQIHYLAISDMERDVLNGVAVVAIEEAEHSFARNAFDWLIWFEHDCTCLL
ncbi:hypothetical protein FBQ87_07035 [Sphingobacteriales bacterium CHB3]|nr:hypothetical protein [Sphingobacteriales bacterium CHB3]